MTTGAGDLSVWVGVALLLSHVGLRLWIGGLDRRVRKLEDDAKKART